MTPDSGPGPDFAADDRFVRALARRLAGDSHLGDDAAQETWLRALQQAQAPALFPEPGRGWLAVVARNAVFQALRGSQRRQRRERMAALQRTAQEAGDRNEPDASQQARLVAAVRALPDAYRVVVQMRFFDGHMPVAIADALGEPVETVRTRLKRAMERLRAAMTAGPGQHVDGA